MPIEIPRRVEREQGTTNQQELRVIPLHSHEHNHIIMPHNNRLPRGFVQEGENTEQTARRVAIDRLNLSGLKTVVRLHHESGVSAHVVEAAHGVKTNLRNGFAARAFALDYLIGHSYANPDQYDPIDVDLLRMFAERPKDK